MVFIDLPTISREERRAAAGFRKELIGNGFSMMQYSVYTRYCHSDSVVKTHMMRLKRYVPSNGCVRALIITEHQFKSMEILAGESSKQEQNAPRQLSFL